jgi:hypothetical protein
MVIVSQHRDRMLGPRTELQRAATQRGDADSVDQSGLERGVDLWAKSVGVQLTSHGWPLGTYSK